MAKYKHLTKEEFNTIKSLIGAYSLNRVAKFTDRSYSLVKRVSDCTNFEAYVEKYNPTLIKTKNLPKRVVTKKPGDDRVVMLLQEIVNQLVILNQRKVSSVNNKKKGWF